MDFYYWDFLGANYYVTKFIGSEKIKLDVIKKPPLKCEGLEIIYFLLVLETYIVNKVASEVNSYEVAKESTS